jgi:hypothetical protein
MESALFWFIFGFFVSEIIGVVTSVTPDAACKNLLAWWRLLRRSRDS